MHTGYFDPAASLPDGMGCALPGLTGYEMAALDGLGAPRPQQLQRRLRQARRQLQRQRRANQRKQGRIRDLRNELQTTTDFATSAAAEADELWNTAQAYAGQIQQYQTERMIADAVAAATGQPGGGEYADDYEYIIDPDYAAVPGSAVTFTPAADEDNEILILDEADDDDAGEMFWSPPGGMGQLDGWLSDTWEKVKGVVKPIAPVASLAIPGVGPLVSAGVTAALAASEARKAEKEARRQAAAAARLQAQGFTVTTPDAGGSAAAPGRRLLNPQTMIALAAIAAMYLATRRR